MSKLKELSADLPLVVNQAISNRIKDLHTAMPGIVQTFDATTQLASVQPAIKRIFKTIDGNREFLTPSNLPLLINVPVHFPRGGGYSITFPVANGDECLLSFCERSIDNWQQEGGVQEPAAKRFHSLSDAIAFVGISSSPNVITGFSTESLVLKSDNSSSSVEIKDSEINISGNSTVTVTAPITTVNGDMTVTGTITGSDVVTDTIASVNAHVHVGSPTAPVGPVSPTGVSTG